MPQYSQIILPVAGVLAVALMIGMKDKLSPGRPAGKPAASSVLHGYLPLPKHNELARLLPVPPDAGSAAGKQDEDVRLEMAALRSTARFEVAQADSITTHPKPIEAFSCAFGTEFSAERTPFLFKLLARVRFDVRASTFVLKQYYRRPRPFVAEGGTTCSPEEQQKLQASGSYPSAGSAVGWTFANVLAELNPSHRRALIARGYEYGQSRLICDGEWASDVDAGRKLGDVIFNRLQESAEFRTDLARAKAELARVKASPIEGSTQCKAEAIALASAGASHAGAE
jgi:acid phosphatase (class A)